MLFSSPVFFGVLSRTFSFSISITPRRARILLIIVGSTVFYAWWKVSYVWLPYLLMAIAYVGVLWIEAAVDAAGRKRRLLLTIFVLFLPLAIFKYTDFIYRDVIGPLLRRSRQDTRPAATARRFVRYVHVDRLHCRYLPRQIC